MSRKYLVAIDGSEHAWKALDLATEMAKAADAELVILHVVPFERLPAGLEQFTKVEGVSIDEENARFHAGRTMGDKLTDEGRKRAQAAGAPRITTEVAEGNTAEEIVLRAELPSLDMVFLGSRGLSDLSGLLLGSVSHKVMHLAPCTCVVVK